jgi:predicted DCC family thiol-disulfide oxidoreductase YuxK
VTHLILWDGECGFCRRSVEWLMAHDRQGQLTATPYQMAASPPMTPQLAEACSRAVHVITAQGEVLKAGRAVLFCLEVVGYRWFARVFRIPPLIWMLEAGYWLVARNRRLFSRFFFRRRKGPGTSHS